MDSQVKARANRPANYKTKQRDAILEYMSSLGSAHVTAAQISAYFTDGDIRMGRTTVYRHLDKLTELGIIRKYAADGMACMFYQYAGGGEDCGRHVHLKCEGCGDLIHLENDSLKDLERYVFNKHSFQVNAGKSVLYGKCVKCSANFGSRED